MWGPHKSSTGDNGILAWSRGTRGPGWRTREPHPSRLSQWMPQVASRRGFPATVNIVRQGSLLACEHCAPRTPLSVRTVCIEGTSWLAINVHQGSRVIYDHSEQRANAEDPLWFLTIVHRGSLAASKTCAPRRSDKVSRGVLLAGKHRVPSTYFGIRPVCT